MVWWILWALAAPPSLDAEPDPKTPPPAPPAESEEPAPPPIPRAIIDAEVKRVLPELRACFASQPPPDPEAPLVPIEVSYTIGADGTVTEATVTGADDAAACAEAVLRTMSFPAPEGGGEVIVSYPWR